MALQRASSTLDVDFCCTLVASNTLGERGLKAIANAYYRALMEFKRYPEKWLEYYSGIVGIDTSTLRSAVEAYSLAEDISAKTIEKITSSYAPLIPAKEVYSESIYSTPSS